jgi:teichuronic acid biosynthesis glycosyltransferase TuaG
MNALSIPRMSDLVSIIVPAYNAELTISDAIRSVVGQSHRDWEMLIADDCSKDETRAIVADWATREPRIRLLALDKNAGPALARNACLSQAKGDWFAFLDSDDYWLPQKLEKSIAFAKANDAALVFTAFRRISPDGSTTGRLIEAPATLTYGQLLGNTAIATSTVLVNAKVAGDLRVEDSYYDDFVRWLLILKRGHKAHGLNEDLMRYRVVKGSVSNNKWRSARKVWFTLRHIEKLGLLRSAWHFARYALNGLVKYSRY